MACGIPSMMSFVWYLRDKAKGADDSDGDAPPAPPPTAATTRTEFDDAADSSFTQQQHQDHQRVRSHSHAHSHSQSNSSQPLAQPPIVYEAPPSPPPLAHTAGDISSRLSSDAAGKGIGAETSGSPASLETKIADREDNVGGDPGLTDKAVHGADADGIRALNHSIPSASSTTITSTHTASGTQIPSHPTTINMASDDPHDRCYATLLTRPSYLPGVIVLAHTLQKHKSKYPLVVLVTPSLPLDNVRVLETAGRNLKLQDGRDRLIVWKVEPLLPDKANMPESLIAERFEDTWTKLRVFELTSYSSVCFLDADIGLFGDIDSVFDLSDRVLPGKDWLAATHACVCNLDKDKWADADWKQANCAYTPLRHPAALEQGPNVPAVADNDPRWSTHTLLNGGVFVFYPSETLWADMLRVFRSSNELKAMKFPDQDFLALYFKDKWRTIPWRFNALKTMRYWHENIWARDEDVVALHYIVDKPWARRVASDGIAGHLGRDGETHKWWWNLWVEWVERTRPADAEDDGFEEMMSVLNGLVAGPLNKEQDERQVEENQRAGFPVPVPAH